MQLNDVTSIDYRKVKKVLSVLEDCRIKDRRKIENIFFLPAPYKETGAPLPDVAGFMPFPDGALWGEKTDSHVWFHFRFKVPESFVGRGRIELTVSTEKSGWDASNPQFLLYIDGKMRQGFDVNHREFVLEDMAVEYDCLLYAYTGTPSDTSCRNLRLFADIQLVDEDVERLYYDLKVPFETLAVTEKNSLEYIRSLDLLHQAVNLVNFLEIPSAAFDTSVKDAIAFLEKEYYGNFCKKGNVGISCIGHTHIDCAWLWTLAQTREKVQRSFSTVLSLMRRFPEYRFMSSQALLYRYLKEEAPEVFEEVKRAVKEGRWEVEGAMWVEADCNLTSGESLVRQVVYGKEFFRREFGVENKVLWLPDVFGYSAALPQILRKCNVDWFLTSKISWNETNPMPYDTFAWQGIDGTPLPTYFLTAQNGEGKEPENYATYNAQTEPSMLAGTWRRYQQKTVSEEVLLTYGFGDGGGGPTVHMLENLRRAAAGIPGCPVAKQEFAGDFLSRLGEKIRDNPRLPTWRGELYLEFHRGTYTSQARNKRNNRKAELLYQAAESAAVAAGLLTGAAYPKAALKEGWLSILTNQFHDIIPGSSIHEVYEQCEKDYAALFRTGEGVLADALSAIAARIPGKEGEYAVFNPLPFAYTGPVRLEGETVHVADIPAHGYKTVGKEKPVCLVRLGEREVETPRFLARFDEKYNLKSLFDKKAEREVLTAPGNRLEIYEDMPDEYDAWELSPYYKDKVFYLDDLTSVEEIHDGCRAGFALVRQHMSSTVRQKIWFYGETDRIDFETEVDWQQTHQMLKVAFPVDINSDKATYEIQFGTIERPTHTNTSWDRAKFEVCAQKFADLSEGGYGVSLLNDCKYGHDIHGGVMRLSLLKSATYPDPTADKGKQVFTYSLYPHMGSFGEADTAKAAYMLNEMPAVLPLSAGEKIAPLPASFSLVHADRDNILPETVKQAEEEEAVIVRLYECKNRKTPFHLTFGFPVASACLCDMEEKDLTPLTVEKGKNLALTARPFDILTVKIYPVK